MLKNSSKSHHQSILKLTVFIPAVKYFRKKLIKSVRNEPPRRRLNLTHKFRKCILITNLLYGKFIIPGAVTSFFRLNLARFT
jgi:hypothetical protein